MNSQTNINIQPELDFNHFYQSRLLYFGQNIKILVFRYILAATALLFLCYRFYKEGIDIILLIGLGGVIYFLGGRQLLLYFESKRLWQTFVELGINNSYVFDEDGIFVSNKQTEKKFLWENILSWKMDKKYILILINKNFFITLIQEQLNEGELKKLILLLKSNLGDPKFK